MPVLDQSRVQTCRTGHPRSAAHQTWRTELFLGPERCTAILKTVALGRRCFQKLSTRAECLLQRAVLTTRATFAQLQHRTNGFCEREVGMPRVTRARGTAVFGVSSARYCHCRSCLVSHNNGCGPPYGVYLRRLVGLMNPSVNRLGSRCSTARSRW